MKDFLKKVKLNEKNISMALGIVVVILVSSLLISYFKSVNKKGETTSANTEESQTLTGEGEYVVAPGDSLWTISEKTYGTGYNWTKVYEANREVIGENPGLLETGTKLVLPKTETVSPVVYTVQPGDNLWNISVKTCSNGYAWVNTARENNLANPNLLHVGQVLTIICQ